MKMKCYDCEQEMEANTRNAMLMEFYAHYMEKHHAIISGASEAEKKQWLERFDADWKALQ